MPDVSFEVIPAIDVSHGKLCRMAIGGPAPVEAFNGDPLAAAEAMLAKGARRLHVVDVDLAFEGKAVNLDVVRAIAGLGTRVQASGGIHTDEGVGSMLDAGADRVVLGSAALADRAAFEALIDRFGERVVVGIETETGRIHSRGRDEREMELGPTIEWLAGTGAPRFLHTNVHRVGGLAGTDLAGLRSVLGAGKPVLAAGGIATVEDLLALREAGAEGAVVGRAVIDGRLDIRTALELVR